MAKVGAPFEESEGDGAGGVNDGGTDRVPAAAVKACSRTGKGGGREFPLYDPTGGHQRSAWTGSAHE